MSRGVMIKGILYAAVLIFIECVYVIAFYVGGFVLNLIFAIITLLHFDLHQSNISKMRKEKREKCTSKKQVNSVGQVENQGRRKQGEVLDIASSESKDSGEEETKEEIQ